MLNFTNIGELDRSVVQPFYGEFFEDRIKSKVVSGTEFPAAADGAKAEFSVYSAERELQSWFRFSDYETKEESPDFFFDFNSHVLQAAIPDGGSYVARYNVFEEVLGSSVEPQMYVQSVSSDSRELRVRPVPSASSSFKESFRQRFLTQIKGQDQKLSTQGEEYTPFELVINFGENRYYRVLSWTPVVETDSSGEVIFESGSPQVKNAAVIRLASETDVEQGDEFWIDREVSRSYFDTFEIFRQVEPTPTNELAAPDFSLSVQQSSKGSSYEDLEDIFSGSGAKLGESGATTSKEFIESRMKSSVDLNVDYTEFENFVHFSSAEERIRNFKFKMETLKSLYDEFDGLDSVLAAGRKETIKSEIESLVGSFDAYEKWLFRTEGNKNLNAKNRVPYPKKQDGSLYDPFSTKPKQWFENRISEAETYDDQNESALEKQVPEFVREDAENSEFVLFINLVAHWFDLNWIYIQHLQYLTDEEESAFQPESLSADLSRIVAENMGLETFEGFDAERFFDNLFDSGKIQNLFDGADISKSNQPPVVEKDGNTKLDLTRYEAQQQVWRRLLSNLTHQYKSRGSELSIDMLEKIFGIPAGSLVIREYGGAPTEDIERNVGKAELEETSHYLPFSSSQFLQLPWSTGESFTRPETFEQNYENFPSYPKSVEMRFRSEFRGGTPITLFELSNTAQVRIEREEFGSEEGRFVMNVREADGNLIEVESEPFPVFDGEWTNALFQIRRGEPFIGFFVQRRTPFGNVADFEQISANISIETVSRFYSSRDFSFGGTERETQFESGLPFIGDLDQINVWTTDISEERFNIHTLAPKRKDVSNEELVNSKAILEKDKKDATDPAGHSVSELDENYLRSKLYFRLDFPTPQDIFNDSMIQNESDKRETTGLFAVAKGFPEKEKSPFQFRQYTRRNFFPSFQVGVTSLFSNKIRFDRNELQAPLERTQSVESRKLELITNDSNRLGIFFSPYTSANREVLSELGVESINGFLGNPLDQIDGVYRNLGEVNRMYWNKYSRPVNTGEYIRYIDEFYDAFFEHVRNSIPARAVLIDGIVIEPSILERDRVESPEGSADQRDLSGTLQAGPSVQANFNNDLQ